MKKIDWESVYFDGIAWACFYIPAMVVVGVTLAAALTGHMR